MSLSKRRHSSIDWKNWKAEIKRLYGILCIDRDNWLPDNALWTTRCCRIKGSVKKGAPRDLYRSPLNLNFYAWAESRQLRYAILSDKYGLHLDTEILPTYDLHPSTLTAGDKFLLGQTIRDRAAKLGYPALIFYNSSPILSRPYFEILAASELTVFFLTRLPQCTPFCPPTQPA